MEDRPLIDIFDILGPVMVGPSSSHTAGAVRIGNMARALLEDKPVRARIMLHGSFAETGVGHGTDRALVAGLLGEKPDDYDIPDSFQTAAEQGLRFTFEEIRLRDAHPNSVVLELEGETGRRLRMQACSIGGGQIEVRELDGVPVNFTGNSNTLIIHNRDSKGYIADVTTTLSRAGINIANMNLCRDRRGGSAIMVIETDEKVPEMVVRFLKEYTGISRIIYYEKEAE